MENKKRIFSDRIARIFVCFLAMAITLGLVGWLSYLSGRDDGYATAKSAYQGTLLSTEHLRTYEAVMVLVGPADGGKGSVRRFVEAGAQKTVDGQFLLAGKQYIVDAGGLMLVSVKKGD